MMWGEKEMFMLLMWLIQLLSQTFRKEKTDHGEQNQLQWTMDR